MQLESEMNNINQTNDIKNLIEIEIKKHLKSLKENVINLEPVAQYCEDIYINSRDNDKINLLNETKSYTTQSLASISYQINELANKFINTLDNQTIIIDDMSFKLKQLAHEINIHNEKVARREIGSLTTNKNIIRNPKVKKPDIEEKPVKYIRKPIDYSILDDIGHGVKINKPDFKIGRQNSYSSTHSSSGSDIRGAPTMKPPTPPLILKSIVNQNNNQNVINGTVRSTTHYRTPVIPPSVPSEYLSRQELGIYSSKKELNMSDSYGGPTGYRRPSQTGGGGEYSGMDTLDRRLANSYIQQLNTSNNSVGYASGKDIGIIKTNLNNIDYATNGTMHRRPQLPNSRIYTRSGSLQQTNDNNNDNQQISTPTISGSRISQLKNDLSQRSNSLTGGVINFNNSNVSNLPPPPEFFNDIQQQQYQKQSSVIIDKNNDINIDQYDDELYVTGGSIINDDDDNNIIPNWVPLDRVLEKVITTYDYQKQRIDELTFRENQIIYVIKKNDDHWYEGIMQTDEGDVVTGLYPYNYARCLRRYQFDNHRSSEC